jgi:hypothetical protein
MPTITINIAARGTLLADGGTSDVGHMWYTLDDGNGNSESKGFSPKKEYEGQPFAPGGTNTNGSDDNFYVEKAYSRIIEITQAQYDAMMDFGNNSRTLDKKTTAIQHCVSGNGFISSTKFGTTIVLKLPEIRDR